MKRLNKENFNSPEEYDRIFFNKLATRIDPFDIKRWRLLLRYFKENWFDTTSIIDLGCLYSVIPQMAKKKVWNRNVDAWGLDQTPQAIEHLKKKFPEIRYIVGNVYDTRLPHDYFDYVVMGELIEHLENPKYAVMEALRILKPGGWLAISTPLNEAREPGAVDKFHHLWSFDKQDLEGMLQLHGKLKFKVIGSEWFPYRYHFPILICWCKKYAS